MYSFEYDPIDTQLLGGLLVAFLLIAFILAVVGYLLSAIILSNTAKVNGLAEISFWAWIPIVNVYLLFAFSSNTDSIEETKKFALKYLLIYAALLVISWIPIIGFLSTIAITVLGIYFMYRLFYRWTGDSGLSVLFLILSFITGSIFFYIYGLIQMKKPFVAN